MTLRVLAPMAQIRRQVLPASLPLAEGDIYTVEDVCALLKVDKKTISRAVHEGQLPVIRLGAKGRVWRFYRHDVLNLRTGGPR